VGLGSGNTTPLTEAGVGNFKTEEREKEGRSAGIERWKGRRSNATIKGIIIPHAQP